MYMIYRGTQILRHIPPPAVMIAEAALALLLDDASLPPLAQVGGILTPATALGDVLIRRLEATDRMHFESDIVRLDEENREDRQ